MANVVTGTRLMNRMPLIGVSARLPAFQLKIASTPEITIM